MRRILALAKSFCFLLTSLLMVSCLGDEDDSWDGIIVDWNPVVLIFEVHDASGNDLLDPALANNLIEETTISFQGKTYGVSHSWLDTGHLTEAKPETRAYLPTMRGLQLIKKSFVHPLETKDGYALYFGEIDGVFDIDEDLVLQWPDGKKNIIHYHCSDHKATKNEITVNRWFSLDGKKTESCQFEFIF